MMLDELERAALSVRSGQLNRAGLTTADALAA